VGSFANKIAQPACLGWHLNQATTTQVTGFVCIVTTAVGKCCWRRRRKSREEEEEEKEEEEEEEEAVHTSVRRLQIPGCMQQPLPQCGLAGLLQGSQKPLGPKVPHWAGSDCHC